MKVYWFSYQLQGIISGYFHQEHLVKIGGLQKHRYQKLKVEVQAQRLA
jgi:hypothetical protein